MKTRASLLVLFLASVLSISGFGQILQFDQVNETIHPPSTENIMYFYPMGQEFRPTLNALNFVDLMLWDFFGSGYVTGELQVTIHRTSIFGPVVGTSSSLFLPPTFQGPGRFNFSSLVPLTPGDTYVIGVEVLSGGGWGVGASGASTYAGGRKIRAGVPLTGDDLYFREGIAVVPEPSVVAIALVSLVALVLRPGRRLTKVATPRSGDLRVSLLGMDWF